MKEWDVFISHASEDKEGIVRPLVEKLEAMSITVWYDENCISYGDSIVEKVTQGLEKSHIGVVILSSSFFKKNWTTFELGAITLKRSIKDQVLIPLYYNIDFSEIANKMPFLADIKAINCSDTSMIDRVAMEISLKVSEIRCIYTNVHDIALPDISRLLYRKQNQYSTIIANHIEKYTSLVKVDRDMAIIRAKIMLQTILKQVLDINELGSDNTALIDKSSRLNSSIKEHFKMIFRFAEIAQNNTDLESVMSIHNTEVTTLTLKSILSWYYNSYQSNMLSKERSIVPIPIGEITVDDIIESFKIEQLLLRKDLISSVDEVIKWYEHNCYSMHGIRDEITGKLVGFVNILPLIDSSYEMIKTGTFPDVNIKTSHIRKFDYPDFYKLYISSICIAPDYQNTEAFKVLYNSLISIILRLATTNEVYFSELLSDACTQQGERLSYAIGMKYLRDSKYQTKLYWGTLIPPTLRLRNNMGKALISFYSNKFEEFKDLLNLS